MKAVQLKNGTEAARIVVVSTIVRLQYLFYEQPVAFHELVQCCKNADHTPFGITGDILEHFALRTHGRIHDSIRAIVLSAVTGEGIHLVLGNPCAEV
jgi:hypothetical protein